MTSLFPCTLQEAKASWDKEKTALERQQVEAILTARLAAQKGLDQERQQWQRERDVLVQKLTAQSTAVEMQVSCRGVSAGALMALRLARHPLKHHRCMRVAFGGIRDL